MQDIELPELQALFDGQLATSQWLRSTDARTRLTKLKRFRDELMARREAFHQAFIKDFRKPLAEVEVSEFLPVLDEIRHVSSHLRSWMKPRRVGATLASMGTSAWVQYQPMGRCLILGPWNYPLNTLLCPLISAVAAGNTVILKPSELTPAVGAVIADVVAAVFSKDEVAVVQGGVPTAQRLLTLPFNHIFFTGSPTIGKQVMAAAAQHLASVTLELGGKSPTIVDETADLARAAKALIWGKLINIGQSCVAPDYVFVHKRVRQAFIQECARLIKSRYGNTSAEQQASPDLARIISVRHANRIAELIADAQATGARIAVGGQVDVNERYIQPTILENIGSDAKILDEEIFGPVLPILEYESIEEVIDHINARPKPLALYVWSKNKTTAQRVLNETSSGGACINHCMLQYVHNGLPFGGVNNSGIGNSHGYYGFKAFSHERAVLKGGLFLFASMLFPPYTKFRVRVIQALIDSLRVL